VNGGFYIIEVVAPTVAFRPVVEALEAAGIKIENADLTQMPKSTVAIEGGDAKKVINLIDSLEELDDVQDVYANFDISDDVLASLAS
jgi:transcriptional/translational regulatory protein YebC/TACO1